MRYLKALWLTLKDENVQSGIFLIYVLSGGIWFPYQPHTTDMFWAYLLKCAITGFLSFVLVFFFVLLYSSISYFIIAFKFNLKD